MPSRWAHGAAARRDFVHEHALKGFAVTLPARASSPFLDAMRRHPLVQSIEADMAVRHQLSPAWWHRHTGYAPQEPVFFDSSLRENLCLDREVDEGALLALMKEVGLEQFLASDPEGLDRQLTSHDTGLAMGLRRPLAPVRALLGNPRIVFFDEPAEGLDSAGQAAVARLLSRLAKEGRTLVIASNEAFILRAADLVLDMSRKPTPALGRWPSAAPARRPPMHARPGRGSCCGPSAHPRGMTTTMNPVEPISRFRMRSPLLWLQVGRVAAFLCWAAVFELDVASHADGQVIPAGQVKRVQHLEGGIVRAIKVAEGQRVRQGEVIAELEGVASTADLGELRTRAASLEGKGAAAERHPGAQ
jgi:hypothetical protein